MCALISKSVNAKVNIDIFASERRYCERKKCRAGFDWIQWGLIGGLENLTSAKKESYWSKLFHFDERLQSFFTFVIRCTNESFIVKPETCMHAKKKGSIVVSC